MAFQVAEPRRRGLTLADYDALPDDADYEIIKGVLYVAARARPSHQQTSRRLIITLAGHVEPRALGEIIPDADLIVDEHGTYVSPDIMYFTPDQWAQIDPEEQVRVAPTLIVEILSPSTARRDLIQKRRVFERMRIPHYRIVDRDDPALLEYVLGPDGLYIEREIDQSETFRPTLFPDLEIDLARLFA